MPWGEQPLEPLPFEVARHDLEDPAVPAALVDEVVGLHGRLDIVAAVHARSSHASLDEVGPDELDRCWAANVRSVVLLAQRFDPRELVTRGEPVPVASSVAGFGAAPSWGWFSSSANGRVAWISGQASEARLEWVDRDGKPITLLVALKMMAAEKELGAGGLVVLDADGNIQK